LAKIELPLIYHSIIFPFENIFPRITFPLFNPSKSFFEHPIFYIGNPLTFYGDGSEITYPHFCSNLDYELELGAIVTRQLRNATAEEAEDAIGGYVLLNDFSDRSNQFREMVSWCISLSILNFPDQGQIWTLQMQVIRHWFG